MDTKVSLMYLAQLAYTLGHHTNKENLMKSLISASILIFANCAFATQLKLNCVPQGIDMIPGEEPPMVMHINLGKEVTEKLDDKDLNLTASNSGTTMAMEINFSTHIGGPGRSPDIPVPVSVKSQNLVVGDDSGNAVLQISSIKSALEGLLEKFDIEFIEKKQSMPLSCSVKK